MSTTPAMAARRTRSSENRLDVCVIGWFHRRNRAKLETFSARPPRGARSRARGPAARRRWRRLARPAPRARARRGSGSVRCTCAARRSRSGAMMRTADDATPPPEHDAVGREHRDEVREADREVVDPGLHGGVGARLAALVRRERVGRGRRAGCLREPRAADEGLQAAGVPAAALRRARPAVDHLVADLARGAVHAEQQPAVQHDAAADAGAERDADQRGAALARAHARLGQRERPRVVDQPHRHAERLAQRARQRPARPRPREVREEADHAQRLVVDPGHADAGGDDRPDGLGRGTAREREPLDHVVGPAVALRGQAAVGERLAVAVEHDPLDVRAAEIESEVRGHSGASYGWRERRALGSRGTVDDMEAVA